MQNNECKKESKKIAEMSITMQEDANKFNAKLSSHIGQCYMSGHSDDWKFQVHIYQDKIYNKIHKQIVISWCAINPIELYSCVNYFLLFFRCSAVLFYSLRYEFTFIYFFCNNFVTCSTHGFTEKLLASRCNYF